MCNIIIRSHLDFIIPNNILCSEQKRKRIKRTEKDKGNL